MVNKIFYSFGLSLLLVVFGCSSKEIIQNQKPEQTKKNDLPKVEREFRAAWIASVANINWPSKRNLTTEEQKNEAVGILDKMKAANLNAVIFQARPQCDAFYKSEIEPWSYYLTGKQGKTPEPFYDPLEFWIEESHKRGMELHVWLNPYRAHHTTGGEVSQYSIVKKRPDLVVKLKSGYYWLDPSKKETQDYSLSVVLDITKRYDIDGIHFDDYFYPYPSYNNDEDFPDHESWDKYLASGGTLSRSDWRRESVNTFIYNVYNGIKTIKPNVKFGLSPFGIWRPRNPESVEGFDQHELLYADAKLWINKGWVDYWTPQLYWKISTYQQSFPVLLGWWKEQNLTNKHFWPGISIDRSNNTANSMEVINQIMTVRGMLPESPGNVFWSVGPLLKYKELADTIVKGPYKKQALIPQTPWFKSEPIAAPKVMAKIENDKAKITWTHEKRESVFNWVVYKKYGTRWSYQILTNEKLNCEVPLVAEYKFFSDSGSDQTKKLELTEIAVTAVDRISNESEIIIHIIK